MQSVKQKRNQLRKYCFVLRDASENQIFNFACISCNLEFCSFFEFINQIAFLKLSSFRKVIITVFVLGTVASSSTDASSPTSSTSSDGTLRLMIQNFTNMADTVRGPSKKIQAVPWLVQWV